jgi:hypothetical protein
MTITFNGMKQLQFLWFLLGSAPASGQVQMVNSPGPSVTVEVSRMQQKCL